MLNSTVVSAGIESPRPAEPDRKRGRFWQLEAVRGVAALYVLLFHVTNDYLGFNHSVWALPFHFGLEAVLVFFVLSGFVISYSHPSSDDKRDTFKRYFIKRLRRIYPIFIMSLALAYGIACLGGGNREPLNVSRLLGNIFMFQNSRAQPGISFLPFAHNNPLWSLAYEWWFYMLFFPINRWVPRQMQKFLVLGLVVVGMTINLFYPNGPCWYLVFFIIWWWGVELAHEFRETGGVSFKGQKWMFALFAVPLSWYVIVTLRWLHSAGHVQINDYPIFDLRHFVMTPLFIILVLAWKRIRFAGFNASIGRFHWLGPISYALYVFHYPIVCDLRLLTGGGVTFYVDLAARIGLAFVLAWLAEAVFQKWVNRVTARFVKANV